MALEHRSRHLGTAGDEPMQACIYEGYGPADAVRLGEVKRPTVHAREALVKVHAAES